MSTIANSFAATSVIGSGPSELEQAMRKLMPTLCDVLFGAVSAEDGSPSLPPCSIIISAEAGSLRLCLCPANRPERGYLSTTRLTGDWSGLEALLAETPVGWTVPRNKRSR